MPSSARHCLLPGSPHPLRRGVLLGVLAACLAVPGCDRTANRPVAAAPAPVAARQPTTVAVPASGATFADMQGATVSQEVRDVANWSFFTGDTHGHAAVILDKQAATLYVFAPTGRLLGSSPVLLGLQVGDDAEPGVGDKPLSEVRDEEKTTPAGRFVAEPGTNDAGEDVVWFDYDQGLAMHRVVRGTPAEQRAQRLASPDPHQRRISFGCVNLPPAFYENVLSPAVRGQGAVIYVLPEVKTVQQVFGAWDVTDAAARARHQVEVGSTTGTRAM